MKMKCTFLRKPIFLIVMKAENQKKTYLLYQQSVELRIVKLRSAFVNARLAR